jgi:predicted amidohydrolase
VSSLSQSLHAFPDLFCRLYDALDDDAVAAEGDRWLEDDALLSLSKTVTADIEAGRSARVVAMRIDTGASDARRFAGMRGIDLALRHVNPATGTKDAPASLLGLAAYLEGTGRLDSGGPHEGALLPRLAHPGRAAGDPSHKRELFSNVVRVPPASWESCDVLRLGEEAVVLRHELRAGIVVACVPVIAAPEELHFDVRTSGARRYYRIGPKDLQVTRDRITEIVANLDRTGALIAVAPELTLTPALLDGWREALRTRDRRGSRLRWVLAGTGALNAESRRPSNTAVLLDGRTGAEIGRQDKMFAFDFRPDVLKRWKLDGRLGTETIAEDLARGRRLTVIDAGAMRVAILICEDLGRALDVGPLVRDLGISHVLTPVFSRPLKAHRWEQQAAETHLRETGATVVVSNSLVMRGVAATDGGTALVLPREGDALVGEAADPAQPVCFRLLGDGSAKAC